jgi:hypothetical protein
MTISDDLFQAILAMGAYNRGYGAGIARLHSALVSKARDVQG